MRSINFKKVLTYKYLKATYSTHFSVHHIFPQTPTTRRVSVLVANRKVCQGQWCSSQWTWSQNYLLQEGKTCSSTGASDLPVKDYSPHRLIEHSLYVKLQHSDGKWRNVFVLVAYLFAISWSLVSTSCCVFAHWSSPGHHSHQPCAHSATQALAQWC